MHKFQILGGKVTYRNRHLNREAEHYIEAEGQEPGIMLWSDPCGTLLGRAFSLFKQAGQPIPESSSIPAFRHDAQTKHSNLDNISACALRKSNCQQFR